MAADAALRQEALPGLDLWEALFDRKVDCIFYEDNQAAIQILRSGKNPNLRHVNRTHGINIKWLHEVLGGAIAISSCVTAI